MKLQPTYYVRHPDDSYSVADPQPALSVGVAIPEAVTLLRELELAHAIIQNALHLMTTEQKRTWAEANDSANLIEHGTTRYHERRKAIADARAALADGVSTHLEGRDG
jgi:nicotinic acid phosphoribosyltransferase